MLWVFRWSLQMEMQEVLKAQIEEKKRRDGEEKRRRAQEEEEEAARLAR